MYCGIQTGHIIALHSPSSFHRQTGSDFDFEAKPRYKTRVHGHSTHIDAAKAQPLKRNQIAQRNFNFFPRRQTKQQQLLFSTYLSYRSTKEQQTWVWLRWELTIANQDTKKKTFFLSIGTISLCCLYRSLTKSSNFSCGKSRTFLPSFPLLRKGLSGDRPPPPA